MPTSIVAASVAMQSPWWGVPTFTLAGGIAGGLITQIVNVWNERRREARSQRIANNELARRAIADYLVATNTMAIGIYKSAPANEEDEAVFAALTMVQLMAPQKIRDLARDYNISLRALQRLSRDPDETLLGSPEDAATVEARKAIFGYVRKYYGDPDTGWAPR